MQVEWCRREARAGRPLAIEAELVRESIRRHQAVMVFDTARVGKLSRTLKHTLESLTTLSIFNPPLKALPYDFRSARPLARPIGARVCARCVGSFPPHCRVTRRCREGRSRPGLVCREGSGSWFVLLRPLANTAAAPRSRQKVRPVPGRWPLLRPNLQLRWE